MKRVLIAVLLLCVLAVATTKRDVATLNRAECEALAHVINKYIPNIPESEISPALRSAAEKIEAVTTSPAH